MKKNWIKYCGLLLLVVCICSVLIGCAFRKNNKPENTDTVTGGESVISSGGKGLYTIAQLKAEFEEDASSYEFKPFYNVEQTTEFTFHFNSEVDPIKAVTVHTDAKCEPSSTVYQTNVGYRTETGVDVIVGPRKPGMTVLESEARTDYKKNDAIWGYATIYYLCVRYDMDSVTPKKLENPIIIPFTIKQEVSTPNAYADIDQNGSFRIKWDEVPGAVSYRIYKCLPPTDERSERAYSCRMCVYGRVFTS